MPRVEVSSTWGGSTPGTVSVSVPVVSAWTHFSFFALAISGGGMWWPSPMITSTSAMTASASSP